MKTAHPKNTARHIPVHLDPAGTDPNRYNTSGTPDNKDYSQQPDNHPSADERMISPDKGE